MPLTLRPERSTEIELAPGKREDSVCGTARLLIVGGGMAAFGLCQRLVRSGTVDRYRVTVCGDEPCPAYDRVNLSQLFSGRSAEDLQLANRDWYRQHHITLNTGCKIVQIDRDASQVIDQVGGRHGYDRLVLATGSSPRVPPISGIELPGVFVYRTLEDLQKIRQFVVNRNAQVGAVIGGGLLGLEAARVLKDLGLQTNVIEMAPGLMPKQLDSEAAAILKEKVEQIGVDVQLVRRTESITPKDHRLVMHFANAAPLQVDVLIVAAGVRANDDLARKCGLPLGRRGGIAVDRQLRTSDPKIFAIGECASHDDHLYGLVAPCYRMADVLANLLAGEADTFDAADESAELKLLGVHVAALGQAIGESPGGITLTQRDTNGYRKLILDRGRVVGAACVGPWDELPQIRQAIHDQTRLWPWQRRRFRRYGTPWPAGGAIPVHQWPAGSIICACHAVTKETITRLIGQGVRDPDELAARSSAASACGSCRGLVCELAGGTPQRVTVPGAKAMLTASGVAAILCVLLVVLPPIPFADSVQAGWRKIDVMWRSNFARQVTGFTLLGLVILGLVFSIRKRIGWFRWGSYGFWRSLHGILGAAVLLAVGIHTGFRLGHHLNFVLSTVFIATAAMGSLAGILSGLEGNAEGARAILLRRWRPRLTTVHLWLFWPLPLLIGFHIFSAFWFVD